MEQRSAPARPLWDRIQTICADRGWSSVRLERETGVARQTISKWKTQPRTPQAATVNAVAQALGIEQEEALRLAGILSTSEPPEAEDVAELRAEVAELRRMNAEQQERNAEQEARTAELERRIEELTGSQSHAKPTDVMGTGESDVRSGRKAG